jgi:hypothetical protein
MSKHESGGKGHRKGAEAPSKHDARKREQALKSSNGRGPSTSRMGIETAGRLIGPIVFLFGFYAVIKLFVDTPVGEKFVAASACSAVLYDIFDVVNWKRAALLRQKKLWPLLGKYLFWFFAMGAVAVVGFLVSAGSWEGFLVVGAFVLVAFRRTKVEEDICRQFQNLGIRAPEPIWGKKFARRMDKLIRKHANRKVDDSSSVVEVAQSRIARWVRARPISPHHDGRRVVALVVIAAALLFAAWTGIVWAVYTGRRAIHEGETIVHLFKPPASPGGAKHRISTGQGSSPKSVPTSGKSGSTSLEPSPVLTETIRCPMPLLAGRPQWVIDDITQLYLGGLGPEFADAPGTVVAGCPGNLRLARTRYGLFASAFGETPTSSQALSVAVDSRRFGAALFLAPAVEPVERLIQRFGAVGGMHRFDAGSGQFYPVRTPSGTYILIRREPGAEQAAKAYTLVPPAVAQSWSAAVMRSREFLWPVPAHNSSNGATKFDFYSDSVPSHVAYTFAYDTSDKSEPELSEVELQAVAGYAK